MPLPIALSSVWLRRVLWGLGGLCALWVVAWLAVPPLLKQQAEAQGSALLGRKLSIGKVDFRPWSLELTVSDVAIATADGKGTQLGVPRIYVDAEMESLLRLAPVLDAITVDAPTLRLTHLGGGHYDVDDILERLAAPAQSPPSAPLRFALYNLVLGNGVVDYTDQSAGAVRVHQVRAAHLAVPFLSNFDAKREVKVSPRLAFTLNGSSFDTAAEATPFASTRKGELKLKMAGFDLAPYLPYLPATLPVQIKGAVVDADVGVDFVQAPTQSAQVRLTGQLKVSELKVADRAGADLLEVASISAELADVRPLEQVVSLASLEVVAPKLRATRNRAGRINLDLGSTVATKSGAARAGSTGATAQKDLKNTDKPAAWTFALARFALRQGELAWTDERTQPRAQMALTALEVQAQGVRWPFDKAATFEGALTLPAAAKTATPAARVTFKGQGTDQAGQVHARVDDLGLALAAPYVAQYLDPRVQGTLNTELDATWSAGALQLAVPRLTLSDVALKAGPRSTPVVATDSRRPVRALPSFKTLELSDAQIDLTGKTARVAKIHLQSPSVAVQRDGEGRWMFEQWLKDSSAQTQQSPAPAAAPWKATVGEATVDQGTFWLDDRSLAKPVRLEVSALKLQIKTLALDGKKPAPLTVSARLKSGRAEAGSLNYKGTVMWSPVAVQGQLEALDIPAHALAPYVADRLNVEVLRADTSFKGQLRYAATPAGAQVQVRGDAALEDFRAHSGGEELLSWKSLNVPGVVLAMAPGAATRLDVREAALTDFFARVIINPTGRINLQDLVKADRTDAPVALAPPPAAVASAPVPPVPTPAPAVVAATPDAPAAPAAPAAIVRMGPISVVNGKVLFSDRFVQPNYSANLSELTGKLSQFSSQAVDGVVQLADLDLRGRAEGTASLEITGKVNPLAKPLALDIKGRVRDMELSPLSPYAIKYAGYGIERGKLSLDVNYTVKPDGQLTASNQLVLNQLVFGDKVEGAPNSLPVKLAVALLADRNGVIDLDLPISGSLNDPQFKLGAVIWKVITNLIVKAVTSPFSLLASALGGGDNSELSTVAFTPGSSTLSAEAKLGLDKVVKALTDRPALAMTVVGTASLDAERQALKAQRLQAMLLAEKRRRTTGDGKDAAAVAVIDSAEASALLRAVYRRADITKPRNFVGMTKNIPDAEMQALLLASITVTEEAARDLALARGVAVRDYLAGKQLGSERLFLGAVKTVPPQTDWRPRAELNLTSK